MISFSIFSTIKEKVSLEVFFKFRDVKTSLWNLVAIRSPNSLTKSCSVVPDTYNVDAGINSVPGTDRATEPNLGESSKRNIEIAFSKNRIIIP
ncbi:MAG: hypothetical protein ACTSP3_09990 [Candidatus Heimdallarchaeaceae archaeon]